MGDVGKGWRLIAGVTTTLLVVSGLAPGSSPSDAASAGRTSPDREVRSREPAVVPGELLVKLTPAARPGLRERPTPENTGAASLDLLNRQLGVTRFEPLARPWAASDLGADLFRWYRVVLDAGRRAPQGRGVVPADGEARARLTHALGRYAATPEVEVAQPNHITSLDLVTDDPYLSSAGSYGQPFQDLWGIHRMGSLAAWDSTTGSPAVVVADVDTGVDRTHPDLSANMWTNPGEVAGNGVDDDANGYVDDVHGWDWVNGDNDPMDDHGHGTHTAGTIAATGNDASGVVGVAWRSKVMALKFLSAGGSGTDADAVRALQYAADMGAKVSSNSWGSSGRSPALDDAVRYQHDRGVVVVAAAGNSNADALDATPASSDWAVTVAASDALDGRASFSNWGEKIDVAAPGVKILSVKAATSPMCSGTSVVGGRWCVASGTSMATPHVAGLAALLVARDPSLTPEEVRQLVRAGAADLGPSGKDASFGYGRIDAAASLAAAQARPLAPVLTAPASRTTVSGLVEIAGRAAGPGFSGYGVEVGAGRTPTSWSTLATSQQPVGDGRLASFDTTTVADGPYVIRLTATTVTGRAYVFQVHDVDVDNFDAAVTSPYELVPRATVPVTGSARAKSGLTLARYSLEWGAGAEPASWSTAGFTLAAGGAAPVSDATLGTWDTAGLGPGTYALRLTVAATSGATNRTTTTVTLDDDLVPGWPKPFSGGECLAVYSFCRTTPVLADLDGDGSREVVVAEGTNRISAFRRNGDALTGFPASVPHSAGATFFYDPPNVADLDGDGRAEIVAAAVDTAPTLSRRIVVVRGDGTLYPGWPQVSVPWRYADQTPTLADLDGDGRREILAMAGSTMHAWRVDGSELAGFPRALPLDAAAGGGSLSSGGPLVVVDLDRDGRVEIAYGHFDRMYLFDNRGALRPGWPVAAPVDPSGAPLWFTTGPAAGDVDGDGDLELVGVATPNGCGSCSSRLTGWHTDGGLVGGWPVMVDPGGVDYLDGPALADLDADGRDEVVAGYGLLRSFAPGGQEWASVASALTAPSVADLDADPEPEIVASRSRSLFITDHDGALRWSRQLGRPDAVFASPALAADVDGDGRREVAASASYQLGNPQDLIVYLWTLPGGRAGADWPQFRHDAARTARALVESPPPTATTTTTAAPDSSPPLVAITSPAGGSTVSGTVTVSGSASDDRAVDVVETRVDAGPWARATGLGSWSSTLDTTTLQDGQHTIDARATDTAGNATISSRTVTVANGDRTPPAVAITTPSNGARVSGRVTVAATASDPGGVTRMELLIDGRPVATSAGASLSYRWNAGAKSVASGQHTVLVRATDAAGNTGQASITVVK